MNTTPTAFRILIYGDSYTFGKIPGGTRHPADVRFTGVLQNELGTEFEIIEEGLRGRMIEGENAFFPHRDGMAQFGSILGSHLPIDMLVIFLGTNDTNSGAHKSPENIVKSYDTYLEQLAWWCDHLGFEKPRVMLVAPPRILEEESYKAFGDIFKGAGEKVEKLPGLIKTYAQEHGCLFFDASGVKVSKVDGVHLDVKGNKELGLALGVYLKEVK